MIEYAQDYVHSHKFNWEDGDHVSHWNGAYNADQFGLYDLNVQNKPTCSECNSIIGFFSLRVSNLGAWEWVIWEDISGIVAEWKAIRTCHWCAPGQQWWVSSTRHNSTQIHAKYMKCSELKDSVQLPYKFHYWISNSCDPIAPVRIVF